MRCFNTQNTMKLFYSRTFWTLVIMFVVNGYAAISHNVPANVDVVLNTLLTGLSAYFHLNPSQVY